MGDITHSARPRFFCPISRSEPQIGEIISLSSTDSHHARDVLRIKVGEIVELCCRDGSFLVSGHVTKLDPIVTIEVRDLSNSSIRNSADVILLCALLKGDRNEYVCDWACELGVSNIITFQSERSIVRLKGSSELDKRNLKFYQRIEAAAKQSHQNLIPQSHLFPSIALALEHISKVPNLSHKIYGSLESKALRLSQIFKGQALVGKKVAVAIGPEGDLSDREKALLEDNGFLPASFGDHVLRAELAAVTGIVAVNLLTSA